MKIVVPLIKQSKVALLDWWNNFIYRVRHKFSDIWSMNYDGSRLIVVKNGQEVNEVKLAEVIRITTYKKDAFTYDPVCLLFLDKHGNAVEVWEGMEGFDGFVREALSRYFDVVPDWYTDVNIGVFTENKRVIWEF